MFESLRDAGSQGFVRLWQRFRPGALAAGLSTLLHSLRFSDGQGQLWPLRVLTTDEALGKPLKAAGCAVVVKPQLDEQARLSVDALCVLIKKSDLPVELDRHIEQVRSDGMIIVCSRAGRIPRHAVTATLLHAGLVDIVQTAAGRYLLTAGRVLPRLGEPRRPRHRVEEQAQE